MMRDSYSSTKAKPQEAKALREVKRGVRMARVSASLMIVLGALSTLLSIRTPLSAGFLVSVAVLVIGLIEWRAAKALRTLDEKAPGRLAINQMALGLVIAAYAIGKGQAFDVTMIDVVLARPGTANILELYPPDLVDQALELLPRLVPLFYYFVGIVAAVGCWATAWFYRRRLPHVEWLNSESATLPSPPAGD